MKEHEHPYWKAKDEEHAHDTGREHGEKNLKPNPPKNKEYHKKYYNGYAMGEYDSGKSD